MANFDAAIDFVLKWEGGYGEDEVDLGGLQTYRGISRKHNPNWAGWKIIDQRKPKQGQIYQDLEDDVKAFYKKHYWDAIKTDGLLHNVRYSLCERRPALPKAARQAHTLIFNPLIIRYLTGSIEIEPEKPLE